MTQKGSSVAVQLSKVNLMTCGTEVFKVAKEIFFKRWLKRIINDNSAEVLQDIADNIIETCFQIVLDKTSKHSDYHDAYIQEILHIIDNILKSNKNMGFPDEFELSLKLHICGMSARAFQDMHDCFIKDNDPHRCLD
uniref:Uncharacterized protein n=1 Tax=Cyprinus carpio TaxID=7962 RepID=A0A8C2FD93_CYPCA